MTSAGWLGLAVALALVASCGAPAAPTAPVASERDAAAPAPSAVLADASGVESGSAQVAAPDAGSSATVGPRPSCGAAVEAAWRRIGFDGPPDALQVKWLLAVADACATVAPALARGARGAAVLDLDQRAKALAAAAYPELDPRCRWIATEPISDHPELPSCLTTFGRPHVQPAQPYWAGKDAGILCDVNTGTYLFLVALEPYLGAEAHTIEYALSVAARESVLRHRSCGWRR